MENKTVDQGEIFALTVEGKVKAVIGKFLHLVEFKTTYAPEMMGMAYNSLEDNLGKRHPKLEVLLRIVFGLFPSAEKEIFPGYPKFLSDHLNRDELEARIFSACLDDNPVRVMSVAQKMIALAEGKFPSLPELEKCHNQMKNDK